MTMAEIRGMGWRWAVPLLVLTFLVYLPCLRSGFINIDDPLLLLNNDKVLHLNWGNFVRIIFYPDQGQFNNLVMLSYALENYFFGLNPFVYHFDNLALHLANSLLIFWLFRGISGSDRAGFITALLFAVHPIHCEPVAWISSRKDTLYLFFYLISALFYVRHLRAGDGKNVLWSLLFFLLAVISKPMAVTLPVVLVLIRFFFFPKSKADWRWLAPYVAASFIICLMAIFAHSSEASAGHVPWTPLQGQILCYGPLFYLSKIFWPMDLSVMYSLRQVVETRPWEFVWSPLLLFFLIGLAILAGRRYPAVLFGAAFFLIGLLPTLPFLYFFNYTVFADKYTYLPAAGVFFPFALAMDGVLRQGASRWAKRALVVLLALLLAGLCAHTVRQCGVWKNSLTLMENTLKIYPRMGYAQMKKADYYFAEGDYDAAIANYGRSIEMALASPTTPNPVLAFSYHNRGASYLHKEDLSRALADFDRAMAEDAAQETSAIKHRRLVLDAMRRDSQGG